MLKATLCFRLVLPHQARRFASLAPHGSYIYDKGRHHYVWTFPLTALDAVQALFGQTVTFKPAEAQAIARYAPPTTQTVVVPRTYRTGFYTVEVDGPIAAPTDFRVAWSEQGVAHGQRFPYVDVVKLWGAILMQPLREKVKTRTVAKNYCWAMGLLQYFYYKNKRLTPAHLASVHGIEAQARFDWTTFFGRRRDYERFNAMLKILVHYGLIEYKALGSQSGVLRLQNEWSLQTQLLAQRPAPPSVA